MNIVDYVILGIVGISILFGLYRGFISSVLNTGGCYDALAALLADGVRRGMIAPCNAALAPMFATAGELLAYLEQQAGRG